MDLVENAVSPELDVFRDKFLDDFYSRACFGGGGSMEPLYNDASLLLYEGEPVVGVEKIAERYASMPATAVTVASRDCCLLSPTDILVHAVGTARREGADQPRVFVQSFALEVEGGDWHILRDVLRFVRT